MNTFLRPYNSKDFENHTYFTRHLLLLLLAISSTVFGAKTFSWYDPVHSWKAGPGEVMTVENLFRLIGRIPPWWNGIFFVIYYLSRDWSTWVECAPRFHNGLKFFLKNQCHFYMYQCFHVFHYQNKNETFSVMLYRKKWKSLCRNVSTIPITAMGCQQCLPLSVVQLKDKHCWKLHCRNGVLDKFKQYVLKYILWS